MSERKTNCRSVRHNNYKRQQFASHRPTPQSLVRYGAIVLNVRRIFIDVAGLNFIFWKGKKELLPKLHVFLRQDELKCFLSSVIESNRTH